MSRLAQKIALITGAASGIGQATAKRFIEEGAEVILSDVQDEIGQKEASLLGKKAHYLHLDVTQESDWKAMVSYIQAHHDGRLDILVNNAGIIGMIELGPQTPEEASLAAWKKVFSVNAQGVFLGCQYAIALMKSHQSGSIINMSSRSGLVGVPDAAPYAASKAAVRNHTKSVALYCAREGYGIRCNSVHPAAIITPLWDPMWSSFGASKEDAIANLASEIPLGFVGEPIDVAQAVVFLASDEARYITGIELTLDGGILAGSPGLPKRDKD